MDKGIRLASSLTDVSREEFQVITLWHVLEHLPNLEQNLNGLVQYLEEDGVLIVAVPNFKSWDAKHYKSFWAAYDVPRHLSHFSRTSIATIFNKYGFEVTSVHPMTFDSFYVSMLSEKYKGNKLYFVSGVLKGLWSNLNALFTKEYSSLIYVLKRKV